MSHDLNWSQDYIEKLSNGYLEENEQVEGVEEYYNGYGMTYIAMYTNQGVRLLFDYYTHKYLRTEVA